MFSWTHLSFPQYQNISQCRNFKSEQGKRRSEEAATIKKIEACILLFLVEFPLVIVVGCTVGAGLGGGETKHGSR